MRKVIFTVLLGVLPIFSFGQEKVQWSYIYNPAEGEVQMKAEIAEGWHLYSQHIDNEIGPVPTSFDFQENPLIVFVGSVVEPESIKEYDPNFEGELNFFKDEVTFVQKIKADKATSVVGTVTYMVCNDVMCLPPTDEIFRIDILR